jgi:hypothetical protein
VHFGRKQKNSGEKKTEVSFEEVTKNINIFRPICRAASPPATGLKPSNQCLLIAAVLTL